MVFMESDQKNISIDQDFSLAQEVEHLKSENSRLCQKEQAAVRYKNFPLFSSAAGLVNSVGYQAAPLIIAALIGPAAVGVYALASRVVTMPGALIGGAVGSAACNARRNAGAAGNGRC